MSDGVKAKASYEGELQERCLRHRKCCPWRSIMKVPGSELLLLRMGGYKASQAGLPLVSDFFLACRVIFIV